MPRNRGWQVGTVMVMFLFLLFGAFQMDAWARAGGGRSFGGGSSRSFSSPYRGFSSPAPWSTSPSYQTPNPSAPSSTTPSWGGGGFMRSLAGGLAGGFLGSLLFSSLGFGGGFGDRAAVASVSWRSCCSQASPLRSSTIFDAEIRRESPEPTADAWACTRAVTVEAAGRLQVGARLWKKRPGRASTAGSPR